MQDVAFKNTNFFIFWKWKLCKGNPILYLISEKNVEICNLSCKLADGRKSLMALAIAGSNQTKCADPYQCICNSNYDGYRELSDWRKEWELDGDRYDHHWWKTILSDGTSEILFGYMRKKNIKFESMKPFLPYYPERIYKNMYEVGLLNGVSA